MSQTRYIYQTIETFPGKTEITVTGCENCPFNQAISEDDDACFHPELGQAYRLLDFTSDLELTKPQVWCPMYGLTSTIITLKTTSNV